jgi:Zn-dependent metalloprotease
MSAHPIFTRCTIVPEAVLQHLAKSEEQSGQVRNLALQTLALDRNLNSGQAQSAYGTTSHVDAQNGLTWAIYDAHNAENIPGTLAYQGHDTNINDPSALGNMGTDQNWHTGVLYHRLLQIYRFFKQAFNYTLLDGNGSVVKATAHYGDAYLNCFWDFGTNHLVVGDGDNRIASNFVTSLDIIAHELTHGIISATSNLRYQNESGALNEHLADVFGVLSQQYQYDRNRPANQLHYSRWTIGNGIFSGNNLAYLRSLADPNTSMDWQPKHYAHYVGTNDDNGGVHTNSGIPNHAFYIAAMEANGAPWAGVGQAWFRAMIDPQLGQDCGFARFAAATIKHARDVNPMLVDPVTAGWAAVGIVPEPVYP